MGNDQRHQLETYRRIDQALEHTAIQARIIARALADATRAAPGGSERPVWLEPDALGVELAAMVDEAITALRLFLEPLEAGESTTGTSVSMSGLREERRKLYDQALDQFETLLPSGWVLLGEMVGITTQLVADLAVASSAGVSYPRSTGLRSSSRRTTSREIAETIRSRLLRS